MARRIRERGGNDFADKLKMIEEKIPKNKILWSYPRIVEYYDLIIDIIKKHQGRLNFHDAMIVTVIREAGLKYVVSFDKDFDDIEEIERIDSETIEKVLGAPTSR